MQPREVTFRRPVEFGDAQRRQVEFVEQVRAFRHSVELFQDLVARRAAAPSRVVQPARAQVVEPPRPGAEVLTARQREIAALIAQGYTNQRIADALVITPGTVANHIQRILDRLELRSRTQVAVWYAEHEVRRGPRAEL